MISWEGGGILPQNSYKPSRNLYEATLLRRTRSVQRLARFFGTNRQTDRHRSTLYYGLLYICYSAETMQKNVQMVDRQREQ